MQFVVPDVRRLLDSPITGQIHREGVDMVKKLKAMAEKQSSESQLRAAVKD